MQSKPAFPRPMSTDEHSHECNFFDAQDGMSFREYVAAQALKGILASDDCQPVAPDAMASDRHREYMARCAELAVIAADALIVALKGERK